MPFFCRICLFITINKITSFCSWMDLYHSSHEIDFLNSVRPARMRFITYSYIKFKCTVFCLFDSDVLNILNDVSSLHGVVCCYATLLNKQ